MSYLDGEFRVNSSERELNIQCFRPKSCEFEVTTPCARPLFDSRGESEEAHYTVLTFVIRRVPAISVSKAVGFAISH